MGDRRFVPQYDRLRESPDPRAELARMEDADVVSALAAASRERDPYLANVLATEAHNRMHRAQAIIGSLAEGVIALDATGRINLVNPAGASLLGCDVDALIGREVHDALHADRGHERAECPLHARVLEAGETLTDEAAVFRHGSRAALPCEYSSSPILRDGDVIGAVVAFRDVSARQDAERRRAARLAVTEVIAGSRTSADMGAGLLAALGEHLEWDVMQLWEIDAEVELLRWYDSWVAPGSEHLLPFVAASRRLNFPRGIGLLGRVWESRRPEHIPDVRRESMFVRRALATELGASSAFAFPVPLGGDLVWVIEFLSVRPRALDMDLVELVITIGFQVGQWLEQHRLREGQDRLAAIVETMSDAVVSISADSRITTWNQGAARLYGYSEEEALGREPSLISDPSELHEQRDLVRRVLAGEPVEQREVTHVTKDGERLRVSITAFPLHGADGSITGAAAVTRDVTERSRMEDALRESEERFRLLAENAIDVVYRYRVRPQRGFEFISGGIESMTGYSAAECYRDPDILIRITHPDDRYILLEALSGAVPADRPIVARWLRKDGSMVWTEARNRVIRGAHGGVVAFEGITRDITALKRAEERFRNLLESAPDAMVIVDAGGIIMLVNARAEKMFGYTREELLGEPVEMLVPEAARGLHRGHRDAYMAAPRSRPMGAGLELSARRKGGEEFPVEISLAPMRTDEGTLVTAAIRDVRERRAASAEGAHMRAPSAGDGATPRVDD